MIKTLSAALTSNQGWMILFLLLAAVVSGAVIVIIPGSFAFIGVAILFFALWALPSYWLMLATIGLTPLAYGIVLRVGILDIRLVEVLWLLIFTKQFVLGLLRQEYLLIKTDIWKPAIMVIVVTSLSVLVSSQPLISFRELLQQVYFLLALWTLATSFNEAKRLNQAVKFLIIAATIMTIDGFISVYYGNSWLPWVTINAFSGFRVELSYLKSLEMITTEGVAVPRLAAFYLPSVSTAAFLTQILLILSALVFNSDRVKSGLTRWLYWGALIMIGAAWILTNSRTAMVTLPALLLLAVFLHRRRSAIGLALLLLGIVLALVFTPSLSRLKDAFILDASTNRGHLSQWLTGLRIFIDHPIFGIGKGMYYFASPNYGWLSSSKYFLANQMLAHDLYIETIAETGFPGLAALSWFIYIILRDVWRALRRFSKSSLYPLALGLFLATVAGFILSFTSNIHSRDFYWTILGLAYAVTLIPPVTLERRAGMVEDKNELPRAHRK